MDDTEPVRPRMIFDCPERLRRAIRIRAARLGSNTSEVIQTALEESFSVELDEADRAIAAGKGSPAARKGRPPKKP